MSWHSRSLVRVNAFASNVGAEGEDDVGNGEVRISLHRQRATLSVYVYVLNPLTFKTQQTTYR